MKIFGNLYTGYKNSKGSFGHTPAPVCDLRTVEKDGVTLVYANVISECALSPDFAVGIDVPVSGKYMADYRSSQFWCEPYFDDDAANIPDETQLLVCEKADGSFMVILPIVSDTYRCVLKGKDKNTVTARLYSGYTKLCTCNALAFVTAEGSVPETLIEKCVRATLEALGSEIPHRADRSYPEIFDYLGWCSWDAMQIRVNEEGLLEKCSEFKENNIPIKWVLLDDMWAHIRDFYGREYSSFLEMVRIMHASAIYDFEADPVRFPSGLASCIKKIKELGFNVGVWYPATGYWRGIEKDSPAYEKLMPYLIETDDGILVPDYSKEKSYGYYDMINTFLKECGADFIKIDNQSMYSRFYNRLTTIGEASRSFHDGMEEATNKSFDDAMINCMGMSSEDMWNRRYSSICRCSDDFQPENRAWFAKHILQCAYNSLLQGQFYWCDWDMWWTDDGQALKNSIARAISGGPIYVSDQTGRSQANILRPLALDDGRILRCDCPATPTADCVCTNPTISKKPMKLKNISNGSGIMALFNLDGENGRVSGYICPNEITELEGEEFAVYSYFDKTIKILNRDERLDVTLDNNDDMKLYIIAPYKNGFAAIGRIDKFISPATVKSVKGKKITLVENGPYAYVENSKLYIVE